MHDHGRLAGRVATCFPVDEVPVADIQHPLVVRFDFGIELAHVLGRLAQGRCEPRLAHRPATAGSKNRPNG